jgi:uncharacterized protein with GYD domain
MPTFVSLVNWTEQGVKNFRDTGRRARTFGAWSRRTAASSACCCGHLGSTTWSR